jgi:hypothetical protein
LIQLPQNVEMLDGARCAAISTAQGSWLQIAKSPCNRNTLVVTFLASRFSGPILLG